MIKLCEIYMIHNGIVVSLPPEDDDSIAVDNSYHTEQTKECVDLLWDITEMCAISDKVRITKARKRKE